MSAQAGRARVTLASLHTIRERVKQFTESDRPIGRPRRRFLDDQRQMLSARLLAVLAVLAGVGTLTVGFELGMPATMTILDRQARLAEVVGTTLFAAGVVLVPFARRELARLQTLAIVETAVGCIALAIVARGSGGGIGPYALGAPLIVAGMNAHLPLSPRASIALAVGSYLVSLVGLAFAPPPVHVMALAICASGAWLASIRHRRALSSFLRIERLSARVARLRKMQEQLVVAEKLEGLRVLVGGMTHELNNALAVSLASVEQAGRALPPGADTAATAIGRASGGLNRIRTTVERLRRFAMADSRTRAGVLEPVDLGAMLDFALENAVGKARSVIAIDRSYEPDAGPLHVHVAALAEALFQVARNAVEAMPGGGTIRASVRRLADDVVLSVADEGSGISPDDLAHVFDPYYSRGGVNKAGMGLSAVYGLVRSLGGTIEIHSDLGRGTEVSLVMPCEVSAIVRRS